MKSSINLGRCAMAAAASLIWAGFACTSFAGTLATPPTGPAASAVPPSIQATGLAVGASAADAPIAEAPVFNKNEYRLGAGDKVRVIVFGEKDLTDEFVISPAGGMSFPLIGEVDALGKTVGDLRDAITAKLKTGYLRDPRVSIEVLTFRPFYILGEVNKPGEYPYTADLTVIKAVATAQGFTYRANTRRVLIKHAGESEEKAYPADASTPLAPGDIIRVRERFF